MILYGTFLRYIRLDHFSPVQFTLVYETTIIFTSPAILYFFTLKYWRKKNGLVVSEKYFNHTLQHRFDQQQNSFLRAMKNIYLHKLFTGLVMHIIALFSSLLIGDRNFVMNWKTIANLTPRERGWGRQCSRWPAAESLSLRAFCRAAASAGAFAGR